MKIGIIADPPFVVHSCSVVAGQLAKQWVEQGHEVHYLGYGYSGKEIDFKGCYKVYPDTEPPTRYGSVLNFIKQTGVELIYAHGANNIFEHGIKAAKSLGVPYFAHSFYHNFNKNDLSFIKMMPDCYQLGDFRKLNDVICCNQFSAGVLAALGKRAWFIPNGVDTEIFFKAGDDSYCDKMYRSYREKMEIGADDFVVLFSGTNNIDKDPSNAILSFRKFILKLEEPEMQKVILVMHTRPDGAVDLKELVRTYGIEPNVKFFTDYFPEWLEDKSPCMKTANSPAYTTTPYELMGNMYRTGNVQLVPSHREGMSTTILEGMACGLPPISSDCPVTSEPITNFSTGFLVSKDKDYVNNTDEVAEILTYLYKNPIELKRIGSNAAMQVILKHDWRLIAKQLIYLFQSIKKQTIDN